MPYNTRRKSLSLPSLGIHLPTGSRASQQSVPKSSSEPANKKLKRAYSPALVTAYEPTPPLSPPPETSINYADISDEIVAGVVSILEATGNRPHTVKELASMLTPTTVTVETSANPQAIISSRLTNYLRRTHTRSPCLLQKQLVTEFHPKRLYYFLATIPRQPFPKYENEFMRAIVSPAPSDDEEERRRREDSPEVDLSSHELDDNEDGDESDSTDSLSSSSVISRDRTRSPSEFSSRHNPMNSIGLERDEREFTQSALCLGRRFKSSSSPATPTDSMKRSREEFDGEHEEDDDAAAASLLGYQPVISPSTMRIKQRNGDENPKEHLTIKTDFYGDWSGELERHLGSPETMDLEELDSLLDF
ncbi:hypothetical protein EX30DRAFT_348634 [Ascodesmis nigricans]|uniref:GDS1 winged helix domain-containing protein n=1 Tax=Ascodesmis nigricans TaxID=341454 RepID=A0A4S2MXQ9_9PEZI|nr:hypothetical protein EX30DRAFT_348634 [Ascodesmis nigricans]